MGQQVVMERSVRTAPYTAVAVVALDVHRTTQTLRDETILERKVGIAIAADALVRGP